MNKIRLEETTAQFNQDGLNNGKARAIAFFSELWNALEAPPTKRRIPENDITALEFGKGTIVKGRRGDGPAQENFIQLRVQSMELGRSDLGGELHDMFDGYGRESIMTISERVSGLDREVQIVGRNSYPLFHENGQLSPGAITSLLEGQVVMNYNHSARRWYMVRLSRYVHE